MRRKETECRNANLEILVTVGWGENAIWLLDGGGGAAGELIMYYIIKRSKRKSGESNWILCARVCARVGGVAEWGLGCQLTGRSSD